MTVARKPRVRITANSAAVVYGLAQAWRPEGQRPHPVPPSRRSMRTRIGTIAIPIARAERTKVARRMKNRATSETVTG